MTAWYSCMTPGTRTWGGHLAPEHPFGIEHELFARVFFDGVKVAEFFEDAAVARRSGFHRVDAVERPVPTSHPSHSDFYCHVFFLSNYIKN